MKKSKLIIFLSIIYLAFPIIASAQSGTSDQPKCTWVTIVTSAVLAGGSNIESGCGKDYTKATDANCSQPKPVDGINSHKECCCYTPVALPPLPAPRFVIPELQIKIPGLQDGVSNFSEASCTTEDGQKYECSIPWIGEYVKAVYNYGFSIAGILAALVLMAGGVLWLVSGGDAGKVTQATELITGSVVGLIILAASYILLIQINPDLVNFKPITIGAIGERGVNNMLKNKNAPQTEVYRSTQCASDQELIDGVKFKATGYCKLPWADTEKFRCLVAMDCSCPDGYGQDETKNCNDFFHQPKFQDYHPCIKFGQTVPYCNHTSSPNGQAPYNGSIAGPVGPQGCKNLGYDDYVCYNGKTYKINDTGGDIQGRRIDIWTGTDCSAAGKINEENILYKGACK